jgi:N-acetyl-anhydromuramyl-L-alanine amidase AmpD
VLSLDDNESLNNLFPYPPSLEIYDEEKPPELWCPFAIKLNGGGVVKGNYPQKYPVGAVVHFTAGWNKPLAAVSMLRDCAKRGLGVTFGIDYNGDIYQTMPLDSWGYHAGDSKWKGLNGTVSDDLVGIEICSGGMLDLKDGKYYTWFGKEVPKEQVRVVTVTTYPQESLGAYEIFSPAQEASLIKLLKWLKENNKETFNTSYILGHDEVCHPKGRKNDPGGALSMSMPGLRKMIKSSFGESDI